MKKIACIYKITNKINGKFYIGSTSDYIKRIRYHKDLNKSKCRILVKAIKKYGIENFTFEIIELITDNINLKEKLIEKEQYYLDTLLEAQKYIKKEDCLFNKIGYNINPTASNGLGRRIENPTWVTPVIQYDKNGNFIKIYPSIKEAALKTQEKAGLISICCRSNSTTCCRKRKFIWRYYTEKYELSILIPKEKLKRKRKFKLSDEIKDKMSFLHGKRFKNEIVQLDLNRNVINIFNSINRACKINNLSYFKLSKLKQNEEIIINNYVWRKQLKK